MTQETAGCRCDYCGLPISPTVRLAEPQRLYCCWGCRFADAVTSDDQQAQGSQWMLARLGMAIFFSMNVMVFTMVLWSRGVYAQSTASPAASGSVVYELLRYGCLLFAAPVLLLLGGPLVEQAWQQLRRGVISVDWLLLAGVVASFLYSVLSLMTGGQHVYFEVGCMVLVAVTLGKWLEATGKLKTTQALRSLQSLLPDVAHLVINGQVHTVPLQQVQVGDRLRVLPGERIPLDATVDQGSGAVDQQLVTGESRWCPKRRGDPLYGGSLNIDGDLVIQVSARSTEGTLQRLVDAVEQAAGRKGPEQRLADRLATWFGPLLMFGALLAFAVLFQTHGFHPALMRTLAIVLIACPCALGIATPLAVWAAMGRASRHQLLFAHGDAISRLARVRTVFFDKTGTLTTGESRVDRVLSHDGTNRQMVMNLAAALAASSSHVLGKAILQEHGEATHPLVEVRNYPGLGVAGVVPGVGAAAMGSRHLMQRLGMRDEFGIVDLVKTTEPDRTVSFVAWQGTVKGALTFSEEIRGEAASAIEQLRKMGIRAAVLTGDHAGSARALTEQLHLDVQADLHPDDKRNFVEQASLRGACVAMVGDGINDAPAVAAADVGVALGCGTDVTREAADVCLLGNDLCRLPWAIVLSRRTVRVVRQNLCWAVAYNLVGVGLAVVGWLNPIIASLAMVGSSCFVIGNSLALRADHSSDSATREASDRLPRSQRTPLTLSPWVHTEA